MQVGTMLPTKKSGVVRAASGRASSDFGMYERAALAHTAPSAISPESAVIFFLSVASVIGGSSPTCFAPVSRSCTKRRMSSSGFPGLTPSSSAALAGLPVCDAEPIVRRAVTDANAEAEATAGQLVDQRRGLGEVEGVARVDVGDAGADRDRAGREGEGLAEPEAGAEARAGEPAEALP